MKSKLFLATFAICALVAFGTASHAATVKRPSRGPVASYQSKDKAKQTNRKRSKIKNAATDVEKGAKETSKEVSKGGKKAGKAVATGSEKAAKGTATTAKGAAKATAKGVRKGKKTATHGVKKVGSEMKKAGK